MNRSSASRTGRLTGVMTVVTWQLGCAALVDWLTLLLATLSGLL